MATSIAMMSEAGQALRLCTDADLHPGVTVWYTSNSSLAKGTVLSRPKNGRVEVDMPSVKLNKDPSIGKIYVLAESQPMAGSSETVIPALDSSNWPTLDVDSEECVAYLGAVVTFLEQLQTECEKAGKPMAAELMNMLQKKGDKDKIRELMMLKVPWSAQKYFAFQSVPKVAKKGSVHVCFLDYEPVSYHGEGIYLQDAIMLMKSMKLSTLMAKTIELRPKAGARPAAFGWQPDGAFINSSLCFVMTSLVSYSVLHPASEIPQSLARALGHISVFYKKHDNLQARLLNNLVESAAQRFASRPAHDPFFLAKEFERYAFDSSHVKAIVRLYRQKTMMNSALAMPQRVEDVVIKIMSAEKVADGTKVAATASCAKHGWETGPLNLQFFLDPAFALNAHLSESCHDEWSALNTQNATGQEHAVAMCCKLWDETSVRLKVEDFHTLCVSCGLWSNICHKVLPMVSFSEEDVSNIEKQFDKEWSLRESVSQLTTKEPPPAVGGAALAAWIVGHVSHLKIYKMEIDARGQAAGDALACSLLGKCEAAALNAANYVSSVRLDIDMYEKAVQKIGEENNSLEELHNRLTKEHVADVKRFQGSMQGSDVVFWQPEERKKMHMNKMWLDTAVGEAIQHRRTLKTIQGITDNDICQVNVLCLYSLGTTKKGLLETISHTLPKMKGLTLVFYPSMPKRVYRKTVSTVVTGAADGASGAADGAEAESASEGTDGDIEMHDFGADGSLLPETITQVHAVKSAAQRAAQLAADHMELDSSVGLADILVRYPKRLTFLHTKDSHGEKDSTLALLLIPTEAEPGVDVNCMKEATMFGSGAFLEVPVSSTIMPMSKKLSMQAKRALVDNWSFDKEGPRDSSQRFAASKTTRGQAGVELHQTWLKDLAKTCGKKCLYVVDLVGGSGEVSKACLDVKISEEATAQSVRVCSWSYDPRPSFHELGKARCLTHLGKLYLQRKLSVPGHTPVPAPGAIPRKSRKMVRAIMGAPMRVLSLSQEGQLLIPDDSEISRLCPQASSDELAEQFAKWRVQYPRPAPESETAAAPNAAEGAPGANATSAQAAGAANGASGEGDGETAETGTIMANQEMVENKLGETVVKRNTLPPVPMPVYKKHEIVLCRKKCGGHRPWLVNLTDQGTVLPTGTYLGLAGPGQFISIVTTPLTEEQKRFAWRWTRITNHKRDIAESGNGFFIFTKDLTEPANGGDVKPKLVCMEDIEKDIGANASLYSHSITRGGSSKVTITPSVAPIVFVPNASADPSTFSHKSLGPWMPSQENTSGTTLKIMGLARPVFEVTSISASLTAGASSSSTSSGPLVKPVNVPNRNCVHFFTSSKIELPAHGWIALGP